jgi:hypothetical protein
LSTSFFLTAADLENFFEQMGKAWDPQQPVETMFKQIQYHDDLSETGGVAIDHAQKINAGYAKIFATRSACPRCNKKETANNTWANFKVHLAEAHRQHKHMQGVQPPAQATMQQM